LTCLRLEPREIWDGHGGEPADHFRWELGRMERDEGKGTRERILEVAWRMIAERGVANVTMADIARASGVSRQTVFVQFGSRSRKLGGMARHGDATNPRRPEIVHATELNEPLPALETFVRSLSRRWPEIHPVARALYAATAIDEDARSVWEDRMTHVLSMARRVTALLDEAGQLSEVWEPGPAAEWLWSLVNPVYWLLLVQDRGWTQEAYEDRLVEIARRVLVSGEGESQPRR
jgi:AcrR family transcriptional regulator